MISTEEARKQWIEALRSGEYKQTQGHLHGDDDGYCCLGVACDLFSSELEIHREWKDNGSIRIEKFNTQGFSLPVKVMELLGLISCEGRSRKPLVIGNLAFLNDDKGYTFDQIADALETGDYWV